MVGESWGWARRGSRAGRSAKLGMRGKQRQAEPTGEDCGFRIADWGLEEIADRESTGWRGMPEVFPVMTASSPLLPRPPVPAEFIPVDYFRVLEKSEVFPENKPLEIDLGCGDGSFLLGM